MKEFNYGDYRRLINTLKEDYSFTCFSDVKFSNVPIKRKILLRHDIDLSLEKALEMAEIENDLGVSAIYFLYLRSPFYNIFSVKEEKIIQRIIALKHNIGLHFDFAKYDDLSISEMSLQIKREVEFMQNFYNIKLDSVSFHRPLPLEYFSKLELADFPHVFEPVFVNNFKYLADSRGVWRYGHPLDSREYEEKKNMHILIHPIWWNKESVADLECIRNFSNLYYERFENHLYTELKSFWDNKNKKPDTRK
jgi:hypothetical protein